MNNKKAKNAKLGGEKSRIKKFSVEKVMTLVWKIREVAKGKGLLSCN